MLMVLLYCCKATDKATGKEQQIRIEASSGLTDAEIEKMRQAS